MISDDSGRRARPSLTRGEPPRSCGSTRLSKPKAELRRLRLSTPLLRRLRLSSAAVEEVEAEYAAVEQVEAEYAAVEQVEAEYAAVEQVEAEYAAVEQVEAQHAGCLGRRRVRLQRHVGRRHLGGPAGHRRLGRRDVQRCRAEHAHRRGVAGGRDRDVAARGAARVVEVVTRRRRRGDAEVLGDRRVAGHRERSVPLQMPAAVGDDGIRRREPARRARLVGETGGQVVGDRGDGGAERVRVAKRDGVAVGASRLDLGRVGRLGCLDRVHRDRRERQEV